MTILNWVEIALSAVGLFSVVATATPNRADNVIADILCQIINVFGMNFGKSKNEVD